MANGGCSLLRGQHDKRVVVGLVEIHVVGLTVFPGILLKLEHLIFFHLFMTNIEPIFICTS